MVLALGIAMFLLSGVSGMLGTGVALVAMPVLSFVFTDLTNEVQALSLILNGVTALAAALAFGWARSIDYPRAAMLAMVAIVATPMGALLAREAMAWMIWGLYFASVAFTCHRMLSNPSVAGDSSNVRFRAVLVLAVPAAVLTGFIGVGPGFLFVPLMIYFGLGIRQAAAINAVAVVPSSFAAAIPHWQHMTVTMDLVIALSVASALGAGIGAVISSRAISSAVLRWVFVITVVFAAAGRAVTLLF